MAGNLFDLFDDSLKSEKNLVPSAPTSLSDLSSSLGGSSAVTAKIDLTREVVPLIDYSKFENFVFFNSALDYFNISGERIINEYPLTGTYTDHLRFISGSDPYQRYLLEVWPKAEISAGGGEAQLGYTEPPTTGLGVNSNTIYLFKYTLSSSMDVTEGVVTTLDDNTPNATARSRVLIYSDSGGVPGSLAGSSAELVGFQPGENRYAFSGVTLSPGSYWIGIHSDTVILAAHGNSPGSWDLATLSDSYADGPPQSGAFSTAGGYPVALCAYVLGTTGAPLSELESVGVALPVTSLEDQDLQDFIRSQQDSASLYDRGNSNIITSLVPAQYLILEDELQSNILKHLLFLLARQFDEIKVKIDQFTKVFQANYTEFDQAPDALLTDALSFWGWKTKGNFLSADAFQYLFGVNVTGAEKLERELYDIKNEFWRRTLQNLPQLYKTKGTRESVESLLRVYGLDEKIVKLKEYGMQLHSKIQTNRINSEKSGWALAMSSGSSVTSPAFAFSTTSTFEVNFRLPPDISNLQPTGSIFFTSQGNYAEELWVYAPESGTKGQLKWVCSSGSVPQQSVTLTDVPVFDGRWYHVAVKRSGSYADIRLGHLDEDRIDWEFSGSGTVDNRYGSGNISFGFGGINKPAEGWVNNGRAWKMLLSETEIQDHILNQFSYGVDTPERLNNLSLRWLVDEVADVSGVFDSSMNGMTGSIVSCSYEQFLFEYNFIAPPDWGWNEDKIRISEVSKVNPSEKFAESNLLSLEFNLIDALNEDISCMVSSLNHWNNIIGEPTNRYRETYHNVDTLRKQYFTRLTGRLNFRVFADFLDFFDRTFIDLVKKLVPARAKFKGAEFVVESHMLERPKLQYTYRRADPRFEPEGLIRMISPRR